MKKNKNKILVTGGAGFIGAHLTNNLLKLGYKVLVVDKLNLQGGIPFVNKKCQFLKGDITDLKVIKKIKIWKPKIIFHLAAQSAVETAYDNPKSDILTNSYGTYLISNLAKELKVKKFIYTSTVAIYGNNPKKGVDENSKPNPESLYGISKLSGEMFAKQILRNTSTKVIIFRVFNTYGPGENLNNLKKGMVSIFSSYVWKKKPIIVKGSLKRFRDLVYIDDCVEILLKSLKINFKKNFEIFNLSTGENFTVKKIIENILKASKKSNKYPLSISKGTKDDSFGFHTSSDKIKKILKFKPKYNLKTGLKKYFDWINLVPNNSKILNYHPLNLKNKKQ